MCAGVWKYVYQHIYKPIPEKHQLNLITEYNSFQKPFTYEFIRKEASYYRNWCISAFYHTRIVPAPGAGATGIFRPHLMKHWGVSTTNACGFWMNLVKEERLRPVKMLTSYCLTAIRSRIFQTQKNCRRHDSEQWLPKTKIDKRLLEIKESYKSWQRKEKSGQ